MKHSIRTELESSLQPFELSEQQLDQMAKHFETMLRWNTRQNLTSVVEPQEAAWRHYRDSLEGMALLEGSLVADMGSGGGFPGIPLAIARPDIKFVLVEPRSKRVSFLEAVISAIGISENTMVLKSRSETDPPVEFDTIVSRATFSDVAQLASVKRWLSPKGRLLLWKSGGEGAEHAYAIGERERGIFSYAYADL